MKERRSQTARIVRTGSGNNSHGGELCLDTSREAFGPNNLQCMKSSEGERETERGRKHTTDLVFIATKHQGEQRAGET